MARVSAFFGHMQRFYAALDHLADSETGVYKGHPTKVIDTLKIPQPYYSRLMRDLERMGCLTRLQRGSRNSESHLAIHKPPTLEDFLALGDDDKTERQQQRDAIIRRQISDLNTRLMEVEKRLDIEAGA